MERAIGNDLEGTSDEWGLLFLFFPDLSRIGWKYHRSNVRAHLLACVDYDLQSSLSHHSWPFDLIMKRDAIGNENELRKFRPRSDLLVSKSTLPRLLVEVNSKPKNDWPEDLVRMLLTGAAVVRFANRYLDGFMAEKNFVLFALYIWDHGEVYCYSLFQEPNSPEVCWTLYTTKLIS